MGNFSSHATHAIAGQNSMTPFAPSSDLLAMLSRGISTGSNEPSQTGQSLLDSSNTDTTNQPLMSAGHIAHIPPNRETRRVPFDMSDFPALPVMSRYHIVPHANHWRRICLGSAARLAMTIQ